MARTQYSVEFKLRVVREAEEVGNAAEVARRYELHPNVVYRWLGAYRRDGEAAFGRKIRRASHGVPVDTARMREVESENERLRSQNDPSFKKRGGASLPLRPHRRRRIDV